MDWIYLSPHLDDAALSCGGLIWQQAQAGKRASIWTVCAGDPPPGPFSPFAQSLHERWETGREAVEERRQEDIRSCQLLEADYRHLPIPDCIYRRSPKDGSHLYDSEESLFGPLHPDEAGRVEALSRKLALEIPADAEIVCPLALGGHVDHRLTRAAAELMRRPLWYFLDYPYTLESQEQLTGLRESSWSVRRMEVSEAAMQRWIASVAAHRSQISTFWGSLDEMETALRSYCQRMGGVLLWQPPYGEES